MTKDDNDPSGKFWLAVAIVGAICAGACPIVNADELLDPVADPFTGNAQEAALCVTPGVYCWLWCDTPACDCSGGLFPPRSGVCYGNSPPYPGPGGTSDRGELNLPDGVTVDQALTFLMALSLDPDLSDDQRARAELEYRSLEKTARESEDRRLGRVVAER